MKDMSYLYIFVALMVFNLLATFVYIFGFGGLVPAFKKTMKPAKRP